MRTFPGRAFLAGLILFLAVSALPAQNDRAQGDYAGVWFPVEWDGTRSIIAGITRIEISPREEGYGVVVYWISQGWPTRFRGTGVAEKDKLKVIIETTNHGVGREDLWHRDEGGNLVAWGKSFKKSPPGVAPGYKGL